MIDSNYMFMPLCRCEFLQNCIHLESRMTWIYLGVHRSKVKAIATSHPFCCCERDILGTLWANFFKMITNIHLDSMMSSLEYENLNMSCNLTVDFRVIQPWRGNSSLKMIWYNSVSLKVILCAVSNLNQTFDLSLNLLTQDDAWISLEILFYTNT